MPEERQPRGERLTQRSATLTAEQWAWLDERGVRSQTRSAAAELRRLVAEAMEREKREQVVGAAPEGRF